MAYQHVISSKKSSGHLISVSALKIHFNIYLYVSLNDRLIISVISFARFHYKNCKNTINITEVSILFSKHISFTKKQPLSSYCNLFY